MIALPNPGGSFTCTIFAPFQHFDLLDKAGDSEVAAFFRATFPDAAALMPDVVVQYRENPTGALVGIKVNPWNYEDKVVLMGDAAHAIVPFFGQVGAWCCVSVLFGPLHHACARAISC